MPGRRKICVVLNSRSNYGRIMSALRAFDDHADLDLQLIVGASALLHRFGTISELISADGFRITSTVYSILEGETPTTMAKSTGIAIMELATQFENLKPDVVLTVADRFETIATAISAAYMNIPLAHTQGGEVTGSIDESVRHAVSKFANIHFPATEKSAEILRRMGEDPSTVHLTGCPSIDVLKDTDLSLPKNFLDDKGGVGADLDLTEPYLLVLQHPVTTEYGSGFDQIRQTLEAVHVLDMQAVWLWPNVDAGSEDVAKGIRIFREGARDEKIRYFVNLHVKDYARLLNNAACVVGNTSSSLREGAFLGVPAVNIGTRQTNRESGPNVINVGHDAQSIVAAVRRQIANGRYEKSTLYGDGNAGKKIADIIASAEFRIQKALSY